MPGTTKRTPMSSVDKAWFEMDSATNLMIINGLMWFEGKVDFELFTHILENRFIERYERFRQRIVTGSDGRLYWEQDPHFDLRAHVRRVALPEPRTQEGLQALVSSIINEPLDRRKPLWRFFLVEDVEGGTALFGRIHHCIGDGIALIRVLLDMTSEEREASLQLTTHFAQPPARKRRRRGLLGAALRSARGLAHTSVDLGKTLISQTLLTLEDHSHPAMIARSLGLVSAASTAILAKLLILPPDRPTVFKGELSAIKRVVWSQPLDLAKIKEIGRAFDATINDVLIAAVAGALRDYMLQAQDDPNAGNINAMVPVNLRPLEQAGDNLVLHQSLGGADQRPWPAPANLLRRAAVAPVDVLGAAVGADQHGHQHYQLQRHGAAWVDGGRQSGEGAADHHGSLCPPVRSAGSACPRKRQR